MPTQKRTVVKRWTGAPAAMAFAVVFGLSVLEAPSCSNSSSNSTDASAEGGSGGAGGTGGGTGGVSGAPGAGGTGGAKTYSCGSDTCTAGNSFCYTYYSGATGGHPAQSCQPIPDACASTPTSCDCLCPTSNAVNCVPIVLGPLNCSCSDTGGLLNLSCGGV
jgi:hypothetical protein